MSVPVYNARIIVTLRKSILDPQGKAVELGIHTMGYTNVEQVRIGKFVEMQIDAPNQGAAEKVAREAAQKLLANPVMEDFHIVVEKAS